MVPGKAGPIKHSVSGLCIDPASAENSTDQFYLSPCAGDGSQDFILKSNGDLASTTGSKLCMAMRPGYQGPRVISFACGAGLRYGKMAFNASDGSLHSVSDRLAPLYVTPRTNPNEGILLYAKPQPNGATAVFLLNNSPVPMSTTVTFAEVRHSTTGQRVVLNDVWGQEVVTHLKEGATSFSTDAIMPRDSRFYLLAAGGGLGQN